MATKTKREPARTLADMPRISEAEQRDRDKRTAEVLERFERVTHDTSPCCGVKAPRHDKMRAELVKCSSCGNSWMTIPGVK